MNITEKMIMFHNTKDTTIFNTAEKYEPADCWLVCIELFGWLKLEHNRYLWKQEGRSTCSKPLKLDPDATFSHLIPDFVNNDDVFQYTLKIDGDKLYYSDNIPESEIRTITKMAYDYYNPERHY